MRDRIFLILAIAPQVAGTVHLIALARRSRKTTTSAQALLILDQIYRISVYLVIYTILSIALTLSLL